MWRWLSAGAALVVGFGVGFVWALYGWHSGLFWIGVLLQVGGSAWAVAAVRQMRRRYAPGVPGLIDTLKRWVRWPSRPRVATASGSINVSSDARVEVYQVPARESVSDWEAVADAIHALAVTAAKHEAALEAQRRDLEAKIAAARVHARSEAERVQGAAREQARLDIAGGANQTMMGLLVVMAGALAAAVGGWPL